MSKLLFTSLLVSLIPCSQKGRITNSSDQSWPDEEEAEGPVNEESDEDEVIEWTGFNTSRDSEVEDSDVDDEEAPALLSVPEPTEEKTGTGKLARFFIPLSSTLLKPKCSNSLHTSSSSKQDSRW